MPSYMRNRGGVVSYLDAGLLKNKSLDFQPCKMDGSDLDSVPLTPIAEEAPTVKVFAKKSRKKG